MRKIKNKFFLMMIFSFFLTGCGAKKNFLTPPEKTQTPTPQIENDEKNKEENFKVKTFDTPAETETTGAELTQNGIKLDDISFNKITPEKINLKQNIDELKELNEYQKNNFIDIINNKYKNEKLNNYEYETTNELETTEYAETNTSTTIVDFASNIIYDKIENQWREDKENFSSSQEAYETIDGTSLKIYLNIKNDESLLNELEYKNGWYYTNTFVQIVNFRESYELPFFISKNDNGKLYYDKKEKSFVYVKELDTEKENEIKTNNNIKSNNENELQYNFSNIKTYYTFDKNCSYVGEYTNYKNGIENSNLIKYEMKNKLNSVNNDEEIKIPADAYTAEYISLNEEENTPNNVQKEEKTIPDNNSD